MNIEVIRQLFNRARGDFGFVTTILSFLIADKVGVDIRWWYFLIIGVFFILHMIWSDKRAIRQSADYARIKSELFMDLKEKVDYLYEDAKK